MIQLQKILVPTDFSEFSQHAMRYGCEFARRFEAELHTINVVEEIFPLIPDQGLMLPSSVEYLTDLQANAEQAFKSVPSEEMGSGLTITKDVLTGTPFLEIIRYAKTKEIDLIVIGSHGRTGLIHALMGSVAEKVVRKAPCPVLTVRPEGHDFVMP